LLRFLEDDMPHSLLPAHNRRVLEEANRLLFQRARELLSQELRGARFRSAVQAEEGIEVAGLEPYNIQEPGERIDFTRLGVPWQLVPLALLNEQMLARRFEPTVENEFVLVLDVSRSMAFPLTCFYAGADVGRVTAERIAASKPGRLKLIAGAFLAAAVDSGFLARIVTFDGRGIRVGPPLRRPDLLTELFVPIDRHFCELAGQGSGKRETRAEAPYAQVALEMLRRKGIFLFVGDFLDAALAWQEPGQRPRWLRVLELFREWGRRRPLLAARVNHWYEICPPPSLGVGGRLRHPLGDRPDGLHRITPGRAAEPYDEPRKDALKRLQAQQEWEAVLVPILRSSCRGFLAVHSETRGPDLDRALRLMWSRLVVER
jgi:hypothetical protein